MFYHHAFFCDHAAMGECLEHRIIRNNLDDITRLISSDPSTGPTWFAQKLEEKAFIANAASAVVMGYSKYEQTSKLMEALKVNISTSQEPGKEFALFLEILQSNPQLVNHAKKLLKQYGEFSCTCNKFVKNSSKCAHVAHSKMTIVSLTNLLSCEFTHIEMETGVV